MVAEDPDSSPSSSQVDLEAVVVAVSPLHRLMIFSDSSSVEEIHLKVSLMTISAHLECVAKEEAEALSNSNKRNRKDVIHSAAWEWECLMMMMTSSEVALEEDSAARVCSVK